LSTEQGSSVEIRVGHAMFLTRAFLDDDLNVCGRAAERVRVVEVDRAHRLPYSVEGESSKGKPFRVARHHLMYTRPIG
jgi:hypothetical protein